MLTCHLCPKNSPEESAKLMTVIKKRKKELFTFGACDFSLEKQSGNKIDQ
jgi:hypothetical protein